MEIDKQYIEDDKEIQTLEEEIKKETKRLKETKGIIDKQIDELVDYYKEKIYSNTKVTKPARDKIKVRLLEPPFDSKMTKLQELKLCIDNFSKDNWRMQNNKTKGLQFFFRNEDQIAKWLELEVKINKIHII